MLPAKFLDHLPRLIRGVVVDFGISHSTKAGSVQERDAAQGPGQALAAVKRAHNDGDLHLSDSFPEGLQRANTIPRHP